MSKRLSEEYTRKDFQKMGYEFISVKELAGLVGITLNTTYKLLRLPNGPRHFKVGKRYVIDKHDALDFLEESLSRRKEFNFG